MSTRRQIIAMLDQKKTYQEIGDAVGVKKSTVRSICQQWKKEGEASLHLYKNCTGGISPFNPELREHAIALKREHPGWGAEVIRIMLGRQYATSAEEVRLPGTRTLLTWFSQAGVNLSRKTKNLPGQKVKRGDAPHDVWAVDAKEAIELADGTHSCTLNITDEGSGAVLALVHFPPQAVE